MMSTCACVSVNAGVGIPFRLHCIENFPQLALQLQAYLSVCMLSDKIPFEKPCLFVAFVNLQLTETTLGGD